MEILIAFFESMTPSQWFDCFKWVVTILLALPGFANNIKSLNERKKANEEKATKLPSLTKK